MLVCCVPYIAYIEVLKDETCKIEKQYAPGRAKKQTKNKQQALSSAPQIQTITASFAKAPRPSQTPSAPCARQATKRDPGEMTKGRHRAYCHGICGVLCVNVTEH